MSMYNKLGSREICDVVLSAKSRQKLGKLTFEKDEPVLFIDSAKTSSLEGGATTVYQTGGMGNNRLVAWEGDQTLTVVVEDALISPAGMAVLSGAGLVEADEDNIIHVMRYADVEATYVEGKLVVDLTEVLGKEKICDTQKIFGQVLDADGIIVDRLGKGSLEGKVVTFDAPSNVDYDCYVKVKYYIIRRKKATQICIEPGKFAGYYYFEASTLYRQVSTGEDLAAVIVVPKVKIQSNFNFSMAATGDPSSFTFTMDAFPDYLRTDHSKKYLAVIDMVEDLDDDEEDEQNSDCVHTGKDFGDACNFSKEPIAVNKETKLLTIPFVCNVGGNVGVVISDKATGNVVFRESDLLETPNENASVTWSMRDFSSLDGSSVDGLTYVDGKFVFKNGCESVAEVAAIDSDNTKIIPQGTVLVIEITVNDTKIVKEYTVTKADVTAVRR